MKTLATLPQAALGLILSMSIGLIGCQKKRDPKLPYGADRELLTISTYTGKNYDLITKDLLKKANTGSQYNVLDDRKNERSKVRNFDYVDYEAKDPLNLTDNTLMLGRPRTTTTYKVRYVFDGNLLKVMKVADIKDLATDEAASSVDAGQGLRMVPIVSYNVSYFSIDKTRNDLNESTSRLELIPQQSQGAATHFKVDLNSKTRASFLSKSAVLPSNFFTIDNDSDWYFSIAVVSQNYKEGETNGALGALISQDKYGRSAGKVRARKTEDKIIFYNLGVDDRIEKSLDKRPETQVSALTLKVDFVDYRMSEAGKTTSVKEETHKERAWDKRDFMELKLLETNSAVADFKLSEIKDIQIDDGYLSFLAHSEALGGLVRFSLLSHKVHNDKLMAQGAKPYKDLKKIYFREDQNLFGFFSSKVENLGGFERSRTQQAETFEYVNRYNPTRSEIEFRLNHESPEWMEDLVLHAAKAWNAAFTTAGSNIRIRVTDNETGKVLRGYPGDLRYSLINMYFDVDGGGAWGGFGPKIYDPQTGEIIMATAHINVTDRVEGFERTLNNYLLSLKGELDNKYVLGLPLPSLQAVTDTTHKTLQIMGGALNSLTRTNFFTYDFKTGKLKERTLNVYDPKTRSFTQDVAITTGEGAKRPKINFMNQHFYENRYETVNGNIAEQVQNVCPELYRYGQNYPAQATTDLESEVKLIKACAIELAKPSLISVILHEMGHNFGLRHNFYGSIDAANFYEPVDLKVGNKTIKTKWVTSSVMDYVNINYENMIYPGAYDVAAIRWGYVDAIENSKGEIKKLSLNQSTRKQVKNDYRPYRYCTDEHVDVITDDPLCARSDAGTNPVEVVMNLIKEYDTSMALWNHRLGRDSMMNMTGAAMYRLDRYLLPMRKYYEKWRLILAAQAGPGNEYLEAFSTKQNYDALVKKVLDPGVVGTERAKVNTQYKKASELIFNFLLKIAFLPDYSCVTERQIGSSKTLQLFPFSKIQKNIFTTHNITVTSCKDSAVQEYLIKAKNAKTLAEAGYPFDNIYGDFTNLEIDLSTYRQIDRPEVLGVAQDRAIAMEFLTSRQSVLYSTIYTYRFLPNFLDEQPFREILIYRVLERLTEGVPIQDIGLDKAIGQDLPPLMSPAFETEKPLLSMMYIQLVAGNMIPNKSVITNNRIEQFVLNPIYTLSDTGMDDEPVCTIINGYPYCATSKNPVAKGLVTKLNSLEEMKASVLIDQKTIDKFFEMVLPHIPQKGEFDKFDMNFFFEAINKVEEMRDTNPQMANNLNILLMSILGPEMSIWRAGVQKQMQEIQKQDLSVKEANEKMMALTKIKIASLAEKIGASSYQGLDPESFKNRVNGFVAKLKSNVEAYKANSAELDAQADIILDALKIGTIRF